MSSTFGGLTTALSSLYAQRRALDVTGQNIANANTEGYSRQRVDMQAVGSNPVPALYSVSNSAGAGVTVSDVTRIRDTFLESRGRAEHAQTGFLDARREVYTRIENVFAEPGDTALAAQLSDFWAGWGDVANQPGNEAVRAQLLQRGAVVADGLRSAYDGLGSQWGTLRTQLDAYATQVNGAADAVAQLNGTIKQQQASGLPTNELTDLRDLRLMEIAELTGANTVVREDGTVDVFVGGSSLVAGDVSRHLVAVGALALDNQAGDKVGFRWGSETGPVAAVTGGQLAASLDVLGEIIPGYAAELDGVAVRLADRVNAVHTTGYPMDGTDPAGAFYASSAGPLSARTIRVAVTDPRDLGVAGTAGTLDGSKAAALAAVGRQTDGPDAEYRALVVGLGVAAQTAQRRSEIQSRVTGDIDALRAADAGVNLDEEMTNMIAFQRAYEAAARVLNSVDEMLDTLINRTGLVGR
jgi:flagellar hook-associated protein 1 FlgK